MFNENPIIYQLNNLMFSVNIRLDDEERLVHMEKALLTIFIIVSMVLTGCVSQDSEKDIRSILVTEEDENTYAVTVPLNLEVMKKYSDDSIREGIPNPFGDLESLESNEIWADLVFSVNGNMTTVEGMVSSKEGSISFDGGQGYFFEFISPDTGKTYYYADIENKEAINFLTMFSVEDGRGYVETLTPAKIGEYEGKVMFGEKFVNKEYWDALWSQNK